MLVLRSLVSLPAGALPTLCVPMADWPELPLRSPLVVPKSSSSFSKHLSPLRCAAVLSVHEQILQTQQQQEDEDEGSSVAPPPPCGLPVVSLSNMHMRLWERIGVDEATCFVRTEPPSALLAAVLRSLFIPTAQLRAVNAAAPTVGASSSPPPAPTSVSSLTGALVDDSDEEEEQSSSSSGAQAAALAADEEEEDDGDDGEAAAAAVDEAALRGAVQRFLTLLHEHVAEQSEGVNLLNDTAAAESAGADDTAMADRDAAINSAAHSTGPKIVHVTPAELEAVWAGEQRRMLQLDAPPSCEL
jgi:hypothetical protein